MNKDKILNIIIILFAILVFLGIGIIIKKDNDKIEKHIEECKKLCDPRQVLTEFSKKHCICQPIDSEKSALDK